jgi:hypothetical protein
MASALRSPWIPILGIALVWTAYAGIRLARGTDGPAVAPPAPAVRSGEKAAMAEWAAKARAGRKARKRAGAHRTEEPPAPPEERAAEGPVAAEDGLLPVMASWKESDPGAFDRLRKYIEENPGDVDARGFLVSALLHAWASDPSVEAEIRGHLQKLRELLPDLGYPDILLARLEAMGGNVDLARRRVIDAAGKDLSWFPEDEIMRRGIESDLEKGLPPLQILTRAFNSHLPGLFQIRRLHDDLFLQKDPADENGESKPIPPPSDPDALDLHRRSARALFELGKAMEEGSAALIGNLVGAALIERSCVALEQAGDLREDEAALRGRREIIKADAQMLTDLQTELFFDPEFPLLFVRELAGCGERQAARRAVIAYLRRQLAR